MPSIHFVTLANPLVIAAAMWGYGSDPLPITVGAVTTKTVTLEPITGTGYPRAKAANQPVIPIAGGWLNHVGWSNIGIDAFVQEHSQQDYSLIVSIGGFNPTDYLKLIQRLNTEKLPGVIAIELNVSCHNVKADWQSLTHTLLSGPLHSELPLILKIAENSDYVSIARLAQSKGISALTCINSVQAYDPNFGTCALSGDPIKPIALRVIHDLRAAGIWIPIIGCGGIHSAADIEDFRITGASLFSLGSAVFLPHPSATLQLIASKFS